MKLDSINPVLVLAFAALVVACGGASDAPADAGVDGGVDLGPGQVVPQMREGLR